MSTVTNEALREGLKALGYTDEPLGVPNLPPEIVVGERDETFAEHVTRRLNELEIPIYQYDEPQADDAVVE